VLFVGDDWAEDHHDIEIQDEAGKPLVKRRLPEGAAGIAGFHELIASHAPAGAGPERVVVGIETDRGPWVAALIASGYQVYAVNPMSAARYRERLSTSGAKSDAGDAHALADLVRLDRAQHRPVAGDSDMAEAVKVIARAHQALIGDRTRHQLRLRSALREYYPAAIEAFEDLSAPDALELLGRATDPVAGAKLSISQITAALKRARRHHVAARAVEIRDVLRGEYLTMPPAVTAGYAAAARAQIVVISALNTQIAALHQQIEDHFTGHPDAKIYLSQPGMGLVLGARALGEFGDDPTRYEHARARKNYAGNSPVTRASGKKRVVLARYARNDRLAAALHRQAFCSLRTSPGARAYYDELRARGKGYNAALRQLANRLTAILHGCLKDGTLYDETTAWGHRTPLTT
jgi:transposase